ncbi:MAG: TIGR02147 family protein [Bdellovibrionales bacterium]|nr:TIGR02147 family protein [Bdellovibrionales bacterium]
MTTAELQVGLIAKEYLRRRQVDDPKFSLRAFAKDLEISAGTLSLIFNGKRNISSDIAKKMLSAVNPNAGENDVFISKIRAKEFTDKLKPAKNYSDVDISKSEVRSNWYYFAILSLTELNDFKDDPTWIANRLGIEVETAEKAWKTLLELNLIFKDDISGSYKTRPMTIGDGGSQNIDQDRMEHNRQNLQLANDVLEQTNHLLHDYSHITMAIDPTLLPQAREIVKNFRRQMSELLESSSRKTAVYKMCIQLFPLTKSESLNE